MNNSPPDYFSLISSESHESKFKSIMSKYEISPLFSEKLEILKQFEIVLLLDDSGSMNTPVSSNITRWDELKSVVNIVVEIATLYDDNGIDIYFLNREPSKNIKNLNQINGILHNGPRGPTPLSNNCKYIFNEYGSSDKQVLLIIATDGVPTDNRLEPDLKNFETILMDKNHSKFFISFLACSDREIDVGYLNKLDKRVPNIDTLDDYQSELIEVQNAQGSKFNYSFGDHVVRLLLGPICDNLDKLDEINLKKTHKRCSIL